MTRYALARGPSTQGGHRSGAGRRAVAERPRILPADLAGAGERATTADPSRRR